MYYFNYDHFEKLYKVWLNLRNRAQEKFGGFLCSKLRATKDSVMCSRVDVAILWVLKDASQLREPVVDDRVDSAEIEIG